MIAHKDQYRTKTKTLYRRNTIIVLTLLLIGIGSIFIINQYKGVDFITVDEEGNVTLSKERQAKLDKKLEELDHAEQYVLKADQNGYYPCFNCIDRTTIFLFTGQVWRYGVTTKGKQGRYTDAYLASNFLAYQIQFKGTLNECLKEEQRKIYQYAILPENLNRSRPLERPPGNKRDD